MNQQASKSTKIMAAALLAACAFFFLSYGLYVSEALIGKESSFGQVLYNLYAYGGFFVICFTVIAALSFLNTPHKLLVTKIFVWGGILLLYHFSTQLFANVFNLAAMAPIHALVYCADYVPSLLLAAALIALIAQWNAPDKKATMYLSWMGLLVSIAMSALMIWYRLSNLMSMDTIVIYDAMFGIAHSVVITIALGFVFCATRTAKAKEDSEK